MALYDYLRELYAKGNILEMVSLVAYMEEAVRLSIDGKFLWIRMRQRHIPDVINIMRTSLYENENVCKGVELKKNTMAAKQVDYLVEEIAKDGVSLVAIEIQTEKVVGATINLLERRAQLQRCFFYKQRHLPNIYPAYRTILDFKFKTFNLTWIDKEKINLHDHYNAEWMMYIVYFATHPDYYRQGIGIGSLLATYKLATKLSDRKKMIIPLREDVNQTLIPPPIEAIAAVFTTPASQKIGEMLDWDKLCIFEYKDVRGMGETFASKLDENNQTAICMGKRVKNFQSPDY